MFELNALELSQAIREKKLTVVEVVSAYLDAVKKIDEKINAFLCINAEYALSKAREIQKKLDAGEELSKLAGVPIAIKDNISTKGFKTTCASKILDGFEPIYDATVIEKLEAAGLIIIGKLNMDEFAMGGSSETGAFGAVRNPWDISRVAGGSSGGSAAAVAAGALPLSLGTDTGGSIRQPCAFCGVSGIKPTYGAISRYGLVAYASSLDQIGPIGRSIEECAALLEIISGEDNKDATCVMQKPFAFTERFKNKLNGIKIGLPTNYFEKGIDNGVKNAVLAAAKTFKEAGASVIEFNMPFTEYMVPSYYIIASAEASSNLSRYDGVKYGYRSKNAVTLNEVYRMSRNEGFGLEVKRRIMLGSFVLSSGYYDAYYKKASDARSLIKSAYEKLFEQFDMILSPVAPTTAYKLGENIDDPMKMYMGDIYTVSINLAGLPALSIPCGFDEQGLPVGLQLTGNAYSEATLINAAREYQSITDWHTKKPGDVI
ncbi:MAG: Asp-tRNA(Asn)/Glu-tRNA(Gln) amidotransferase subunit GatA [Fibromonadales bacterium]|nr:Asp-tRNA(Asn)/Glu-tRNA(Gln) amidotransferase subunit GatA [Fibromonadales bacterium]